MGETHDMLELHLANWTRIPIHPKAKHVPAAFAILNVPMDDIGEAIDELAARGVGIERYDGFAHDDKGFLHGIAQGPGPDIDCFRDPAGNMLSAPRED